MQLVLLSLQEFEDELSFFGSKKLALKDDRKLKVNHEPELFKVNRFTAALHLHVILLHQEGVFQVDLFCVPWVALHLWIRRLDSSSFRDFLHMVCHKPLFPQDSLIGN